MTQPRKKKSTEAAPAAPLSPEETSPAATPETAAATEPETAAPEATEPETAAPEATEPETAPSAAPLTPDEAADDGEPKVEFLAPEDAPLPASARLEAPATVIVESPALPDPTVTLGGGEIPASGLIIDAATRQAPDPENLFEESTTSKQIFISTKRLLRISPYGTTTLVVGIGGQIAAPAANEVLEELRAAL